MGGLAGFIGTYLIGPRVGLFNQDQKLAYILDDTLLDEEMNEVETDKKNDEELEDERYKFFMNKN